MQTYLYTWANLKRAYRGDAVTIPFEGINEVLVANQGQKTYYHLDYSTPTGYQTSITFFPEEVENLPEFEAFLLANPEKTRSNKFKFLRGQFADYFRPYLRYGAVTTKFMIALMAFTFMFFQAKYFGSLLIQKYQFLIKATCNQQCAQELWSISAIWFYAVMATLAPIIPILFYKKIYKAAKKSKNTRVSNATRTETFLLGVVGVFLLAGASPMILNTTTKYTKILVSYSDGTLQAKLSQKIEMASKREFQGDVDDVEEVEVLQDQREE